MKLPAVQKTQRSPLNIGRSLERNRRKQARTKANREQRAQLHSAKANAGGAEGRAILQGQIDQMSRRGVK